MVPAKIEPVDARPVFWDGHRIYGDGIIRDVEHKARSERRQSFRARIPLVLGIARDDRFALLRGVVLRILQRHVGHVFSHKSPHSRSNRWTTSDMPSSGVNVSQTMPPIAFVRVSPSR